MLTEDNLAEMIKKLLSGMTAQKRDERRANLQRDLIRREAKLGGQLFGPVQPGGRREFFCLDEHTWVWHEEWIDHSGQRQIKTTRYDIRPDAILKSQNGQYQELSWDEAQRLQQAALLYKERIQNELYSV
jgi:hypothetical protein